MRKFLANLKLRRLKRSIVSYGLARDRAFIRGDEAEHARCCAKIELAELALAGRTHPTTNPDRLEIWDFEPTTMGPSTGPEKSNLG